MSVPQVGVDAAYHRSVGVSDTKNIGGGSTEFTDAVGRLQAGHIRPEIRLEELPAPKRIATNSYAVSGDVVVADDELGTGRFVLLHEPAGNDAWGGTLRCVIFVRADIEHDMAIDPALPSVTWTWLTDALAGAGTTCELIAGTTTIVRSDSFGQMADKEASSQVELRASWSPRSDLGGHFEAWSDVLCAVAGLPDTAPGIVSIDHKRLRR